MKKLIAFILCLCMTIFCTACTMGSTGQNLAMDNVQPWAINTSGFEECVYSVVKKNKDGLVVGNGELITTATINGDKTSIECNFSLIENYKEDVINSKATIYTSTCSPIYSEKEVVLQSNSKLNYKFVADYNNKEVSFYTTDSTNPSKTATLNGVNVTLDNEALYYIIRAFNPTLKEEGEFALTNLYDCYTSDSFYPYAVYYRSSDTLLSKDSFCTATQNTTWDIFNTNNQLVDNKIDCHYVKVNRNETGMSGSPLELWLSKKAFNGNNTRVIVKMQSTTRSIASSDIEYTIEYDLVSYRTI